MAKSKDRQQQVVLNYKANGGNMKKAMIDAGYSETYADRNSKYLLGIIGEQIKKQQDDIKSKKIKSIEEIQEWWTEILDNPEEERSHQIKCSELLAKSQGGFIDKVQLNGNVNNPFAGLTTEELKKLIDDEKS
jgi:phage terminase small subunit